MEERFLRQTALGSFLCLLAVIALAILFSHYKSVVIDLGTGQTSNDLVDKNHDNYDLNEDYVSDIEEIQKALGTRYIAIIKPDKLNYNVQVQNDYMDKRLLVAIEDMDTSKLSENSFIRINQTMKYIGYDQQGLNIQNLDHKIELMSNTKTYLVPEVIKADGSIQTYGELTNDIIVDPISSFSFYNKVIHSSNIANIEFNTNTIYEPYVYQDDKCIYIALKAPRDVYNKIIVLDAGHGGKDPGAYVRSHNTYEKDVNLQILLQLKELIATNPNIKVYYTRLEDETIYLNPRVNLANEVKADLFISIHCNSSEFPSANGLEVLYNEKDSNDGLTSFKLAQLLFDELQTLTGRVNRGLVPASEMVIVGKSQVPVALIEAGFISNEKDYSFLIEKNNQKEIAKSIYKVIIEALR